MTRWILEWERDLSCCFDGEKKGSTVSWGILFFFLRREGGEGGETTDSDTEFFGQCVDFCVLEELGAGFVDCGRGGIGGEDARGEFGGEVFARVQVFEETAYGFEIGVW